MQGYFDAAAQQDGGNTPTTETGVVAFYLFHEESHLTPIQQGYNAQQYAAYKAEHPNDPTGSGYYQDTRGQAAEQVANNIAHLMADAYGVPIWQQPTYGYDLFGNYFFLPPV